MKIRINENTRARSIILIPENDAEVHQLRALFKAPELMGDNSTDEPFVQVALFQPLTKEQQEWAMVGAMSQG